MDWSWLKLNLLGLVALITAPIVTIYQIWRTSKVQMKQIRPEVVTHGCRVGQLDVYTYFDENNKMSEPVCPHLAADKSQRCKFDPQQHEVLWEKEHEKKWKKEEAIKILETNGGKCYLMLWGYKRGQ